MTRTPRQRQGEDLVQVAILVPPDVKVALLTLAQEAQRSLSQVGRMALEAYVEQAWLSRDAATEG